MSRPPLHNRAPSQDPQGSESGSPNTTHERRASTHSIPVSYAYGAPSVGTRATPGRTSRSSVGGGARTGSPSVASQSARGGDAASASGSTQLGEDGEGGPDEYTGRSSEPAHVRYARVKQRQKDTGQAFHSPATIAGGVPAGATAAAVKKVPGVAASAFQNTSVNIATAFAQAIGQPAKAPAGGPPPVQRQGEDDDEEDEQEGSGKETHVAGGAAGTPASKKRKKRTFKDPSFKHRAGETSESDTSELGDARSKAKRSKKSVSVDLENMPPPSASKKSSTRRKPADNAAYRPTGESAGSSSDASDDGSSHRRRRSKSKGKSRASSSQAIPIGRRDSEIWYGGKKRRGSKKGRNSVGEDGVGEEEGDSRETVDGEEEDLGGMDQLDQRQQDDDQQEQDDDTTPAPPPTTFFLRPASPARSASTSRAGSHSPFQPRSFSFTPSIDPAFGDFDRANGFGGASSNANGDRSRSQFFPTHSTSRSFQDSYDSPPRDLNYDQMEGIVQVLEAKAKETGSIGPVQAGGTGLRRRMPAPPQLNGIEEEAGAKAPPGEQGEQEGVGSKLGKGVRPILAGLGKAWRWTQNPLLDWGRMLKAVAGLLLLIWVVLATRPSSTPTPPPPTPSRSRWNPFRRAPPPTPFTPPTLPADSLTELVSRLTILESAMGQLSYLSTAERTQSSDDRKLLAKMQGQVAGLEDGLAAERVKAEEVIDGQQENQKEAKELERTIKGVKGDLDALVARVRGMSDDRQADVADLRRLQEGIHTVGKDIASLGAKVAQVSKDVQAGVDAERIARIALEAIEARLPSKLAVRMDNSGKLEIDPSFWKHLRDAFAGKQDVERLVKSEVAKLPKSGGSSSTQVVVKEPSWDEFLAANEVSLRTWVTSDLASRTGSDAIVSKRTFLDMLRRELKTLKQEFETQANENVEKIGQEILSKVAKQEEMKRKDSLASHLNPFHRSHPSPSTPQQVTIKSSDGQNISAIISTLVDSALLRYSKDVLARPDYALYTAGARVIRSLTSPTYEPHPIGRGRRTLAWISGTGSPSGRPPVTALHPDNSPGSCWPFAGQQGQLGIYLSRRIIPSDITLEHVSIDVAIDGEVASAPKEFEVWGVVENLQDVRKLDEFRQQKEAAKRAARAAGATTEEDDLEATLSTSLPPTPNHLLLARGSYDTSLPSPVQTFPVTAMARQLAIPVNTAVLRVLSNHGEKAFTCLYRVRVSGVSEEVRRKMEGASES